MTVCGSRKEAHGKAVRNIMKIRQQIAAWLGRLAKTAEQKNVNNGAANENEALKRKFLLTIGKPGLHVIDANPYQVGQILAELPDSVKLVAAPRDRDLLPGRPTGIVECEEAFDRFLKEKRMASAVLELAPESAVIALGPVATMDLLGATNVRRGKFGEGVWRIDLRKAADSKSIILFQPTGQVDGT